jgi:hypothetical protein
MDVQRIKYERTGGFAGMRIATDFKPDDLPDDQVRTLMELLDDMDFDEMPEDLTRSSPMPDQFTYKLTVETSKREHTVIAGESSAPDKLQELFRLLDRIARRKQ